MFGFKLSKGQIEGNTIMELFQLDARTEKEECIITFLIKEDIDYVKSNIEKYKTEFIKKITDDLNNAIIFQTTIKDNILQIIHNEGEMKNE